MKKTHSINEKIYFLCNWIVRISGCGIFLFLTKCAVGKYSYFMFPGEAEYPILETVPILSNLSALICAMGVFLFLTILEKHLDQQKNKMITSITLMIAVIWVGIAVYWWISSADRPPRGDQAFLYAGASYFLEDNYIFLNKGGYYGMFPYQLALTSLYELLFVFVGPLNYMAIEIIYGAMAIGIVWFGHLILKEITRSMAVLAAYNLLIMGCLPLIFYAPWCYGDIPGLFFSLLVVLLILKYENAVRKNANRSIRGLHLICMVICAIFAVMARYHSYILLAAVILSAIVYVIKYKNYKLLIAAVMAVVLSRAVYFGIYKMYEFRSGIPHDPGIPGITTFAMGLQDNDDHYRFKGWFNNYNKSVYYDHNMDREETKKAAWQNIQERVEIFKNNKSYMNAFFREKILSQWNQPLYQSLYFNTDYSTAPAAGSLADKVDDEYYMNILHFAIKWQVIVYAGMLFYFIFAVDGKSNIVQHVAAITIIGGFFFSIFFEAKARYIFIYYVMMFPFAVLGYRHLLSKVFELLKYAERNLIRKNNKNETAHS